MWPGGWGARVCGWGGVGGWGTLCLGRICPDKSPGLAQVQCLLSIYPKPPCPKSYPKLKPLVIQIKPLWWTLLAGNIHIITNVSKDIVARTSKQLSLFAIPNESGRGPEWPVLTHLWVIHWYKNIDFYFSCFLPYNSDKATLGYSRVKAILTGLEAVRFRVIGSL